MITLADAKTRHLAAIGLSSSGLSPIPVKLLGGLLQALRHIGTGKRRAPTAADITVLGRIHLADCQSIQAQGLCGLVHDWRNDGHDLVFTGTSLRASVASVGTDGGIAEAHGFGLIERTDTGCCGIRIAAAALAATIGDAVHIHGRHGAVGFKTDFDPALQTLSRTTYSELFFASYPHHYRTINLLGESGRDRHAGNTGSPGSLAKTTTSRFINEDKVFQWHTDDIGHGLGESRQALGGAVQITFSIFPVGHGASGLHGHMGITGSGERRFVDEIRTGETGLKIAVFPTLLRLCRRLSAVLKAGDLIRCPFLLGKTLSKHEGITAAVGIGAALSQAIQGIQYKGQSFDGEGNQGHRRFGGFFIYRGNGEDWLTDQGRLVGQYLEAGALRLSVRIYVVGG